MTQVVATIQQDLIPADAVAKIKETLAAMSQAGEIPESETITLDSKALKTECRDVWDAYARVSTKKASVRITVR